MSPTLCILVQGHAWTQTSSARERVIAFRNALISNLATLKGEVLIARVLIRLRCSA